jgi:hypothetical protein
VSYPDRRGADLIRRRGERFRIRFPDGRSREVPWLAARGPERRQVHWSFETSDKLRPLGRRERQRRNGPPSGLISYSLLKQSSC